MLERSRVYAETTASDRTFAAVQDLEYELYKRRLFAAGADVVALRAELADRDKVLDGSNPLHLKEALVFRQALDTEKLNRRELEETLMEDRLLFASNTRLSLKLSRLWVNSFGLDPDT